MGLQESSDNLAEFNIDFADCYTSVDRRKKKAQDGTTLYEHSTSIIYWLSLYRVPDAMIINLFMPLVLLIALQYFIFFSDGDKSTKIANSGTIVLAALAYLNVFRASIPVNPSFTLGDSYALSVLILVLWTVIDVFAFPLKDGEDYTPKICIAHYTLIGVISLYPFKVMVRTITLYWKYRQLLKKIEKESGKQKKRGSSDMILSEWATERVHKDSLSKLTPVKMQIANAKETTVGFPKQSVDVSMGTPLIEASADFKKV